MELIDWGNLAKVTVYLRSLAKHSNPHRHSNYAEAVKHAQEMAVHIKGNYPKQLLIERRPNEPEEIKDYRLKIWKPITKSRAKKVLNVLSRINNDKNYHIVYHNEVSSKVKGEGFDNSLEKYLTKDYPFFESYIRWVFEVAMKQMMCDPNSAVGFFPVNLLHLSEDDTQFPEPFGIIYPSKTHVDYVLKEHYTFLKEEKSEVISGSQKVQEGNIFIVYTKDKILQYTQYGKKENELYREDVLYVHNIGEPPVVILGGEYVEDTYPFRYESLMSGVLPYWDEALREYSDKQAVFVQHVYPERVEMVVECDNNLCGKGTAKPGEICDEKGNITKCQRCKGSGVITGRSPYGITRVKQSQLDVQNPIFPGVEYIEKPTEIVKLLQEDIEKLIYDGFDSLSMAFLSEAPLNSSGESKKYDRAELTTYLMNVSNTLFNNIISNGIWFINQMRYNSALTEDELQKQLPKIIRPTDFDISSLSQMINEFGATASLPQEIKDEVTLEIINKKYAADETKKVFYAAIITLDPLRGKTADEKFTAFSNNVISKVDYMISENIYRFLLLAIQTDKEFFAKPYDEKYTTLVAFAEKQIAAEAKKKIELFDPGTVE